MTARAQKSRAAAEKKKGEPSRDDQQHARASATDGPRQPAWPGRVPKEVQRGGWSTRYGGSSNYSWQWIWKNKLLAMNLRRKVLAVKLGATHRGHDDDRAQEQCTIVKVANYLELPMHPCRRIQPLQETFHKKKRLLFAKKRLLFAKKKDPYLQKKRPLFEKKKTLIFEVI